MNDVTISFSANSVKVIGNPDDPILEYNVYFLITGMTGTLRRARAALQETPGNEDVIAEIEVKLAKIKRFKKRADRAGRK